MLHRVRTLNSIVLAALATAGIATAAVGDLKPCHPDLPGTRSLIVTGAVTELQIAAPGTLAVSVRTGQCAGVARWNYAASAHATAAVSCRRSSACSDCRGGQEARRLTGRSHGPRRVRSKGSRQTGPARRLRPRDRQPDCLVAADRAAWARSDRLGRPLWRHRCPLGGRRGALYAVRISDGHTAEIAIAHADDRPIIGPEGVVYQDDKYVKNSSYHLPANEVALKLVPMASVKRQLRLADRPLVTKGTISAISMDGQRVVFAAHDPAGRCDRVMFWVPQWHFLRHLTHPSGPTCLPAHAAGGITNVAIADARVIWTTKYGQTTRVLAASAISCVEWIIARPALQRRACRGARRRRERVGLRAERDWLSRSSRNGRARSGALAAKVVSHVADPGLRDVCRQQAHCDAVSERDGARDDRDRGSRQHLRRRSGSRGRASTRHGRRRLRSGRLATFNATTGSLEHSWPVPADARTIDLVYGIAVIAAGGDVWALNVNTGHSARLLHVRGRVAAQVDSPGAVVQFNAGGRGHVRFDSDEHDRGTHAVASVAVKLTREPTGGARRGRRGCVTGGGGRDSFLRAGSKAPRRGPTAPAVRSSTSCATRRSCATRASRWSSRRFAIASSPRSCESIRPRGRCGTPATSSTACSPTSRLATPPRRRARGHGRVGPALLPALRPGADAQGDPGRPPRVLAARGAVSVVEHAARLPERPDVDTILEQNDVAFLLRSDEPRIDRRGPARLFRRPGRRARDSRASATASSAAASTGAQASEDDRDRREDPGAALIPPRQSCSSASPRPGRARSGRRRSRTSRRSATPPSETRTSPAARTCTSRTSTRTCKRGISTSTVASGAARCSARGSRSSAARRDGAGSHRADVQTTASGARRTTTRTADRSRRRDPGRLRLVADVVGRDGTGYPKGHRRPAARRLQHARQPVRVEFARPRAIAERRTRAEGVHFVVFNPTGDDFRRVRLAMDGILPDGTRLSFATPFPEGINTVLHTTHRQNFLVPPRAHRSFPLSELRA